jgi:predicted nucleic acid-binding protein
MIAFPDTSFLCALYRPQSSSPLAAAHFKAMPEALHVSSLLLYEFRQSLRFQVWLYRQNPQKGFTDSQCAKALADLQSDLDTGSVVLVAADWSDVSRLAERISAAHTKTHGNRAMDILHVATALHLGAQEFLTFDARQRTLAKAEGLKPKP